VGELAVLALVERLHAARRVRPPQARAELRRLLVALDEGALRLLILGARQG